MAHDVVTDIRNRRSSEIAHMQICRLLPNNPRRIGSYGWKSWESYKDGMTVQEYLALGNDPAGQRRRHLNWDLERGFVELRDAPE